MFSVCMLLGIAVPAVYGSVRAEGRADVFKRTSDPDLYLGSERTPEDGSADNGGLPPPSNRRARGLPGPAKPRKAFGWGDFHCSVKSASLDLAVKGKIVDHGNGSFGVHFLCNGTGAGNVSVALAPSTEAVGFGPRRREADETAESKLFNCKVASEKAEGGAGGGRRAHDPSETREQRRTRVRVSWLCSKPFKVICAYVSFRGADYRLLQKVCPDYNRHSDAPYPGSG